MARPAGHPLNADAWDDILNLKGLSITQAAELVDEPRSTLSLLKSGHNKASVPKAHKIAVALGVKPRTLFPTLNPHHAVAGEDVA